MMVRRCLGLFLALAAGAAGAAQATTLARMSLEQMTAAASVVARVRCLGNESEIENGEIWTITLFDVMELWKGQAAPQISVRLLGGRAGHLISTVESVPRFHPGEEAVLFLEPLPDGRFTVTGWAQGTFRIARDTHTGEARATQDTAALPVFDPQTQRFRADGIRRMPAGELRERVLEAQRSR